MTNSLTTDFIKDVRERGLHSGRNMFSPEQYVMACDELIGMRESIEAVEAGWGSSPTPQQAIANLEKHAAARKLPPGDNDFEDAANIIRRLLLRVASDSIPVA